jgi:hypothetical protein
MSFEEPMRLSQRIIESGAFFKFASIDIGLGEHLLGGSTALGAHRIKFKNNSGCSANGQFNVLSSLSHGIESLCKACRATCEMTDSSISVCLTGNGQEFSRGGALIDTDKKETQKR